MKDWLDSDEFTKLFIECFSPTFSGYFDRVQFVAAIREHFEPKRKWIKITDDPATWPPNHAFVLCSFEDQMPLICVFYKDPSKSFYSNGIQVYPIAWMPLPEPWGEE